MWDELRSQLTFVFTEQPNETTFTLVLAWISRVSFVLFVLALILLVIL